MNFYELFIIIIFILLYINFKLFIKEFQEYNSSRIYRCFGLFVAFVTSLVMYYASWR